jgi:hypothetical protein
VADDVELGLVHRRRRGDRPRPRSDGVVIRPRSSVATRGSYARSRQV